MVRFCDGFHSLQAFFLVFVLVFVRIVPRLPLSGAKYRVEQGARDIHARRDHKHDPPFRLSRLKRKRRDFIGYQISIRGFPRRRPSDNSRNAIITGETII